MSFLAALGLVIGIASGGLGIYEFLNKKSASGTIYATVAVVLILAAIIISIIPPSGSAASIDNKSGNTPTSTISLQQGTTVTTVPTSPATTAPTPQTGSGTVLCQADASTGWDGWPVTGSWKLLGGKILNDGTSKIYTYFDGDSVIAPCQLDNVLNYAVEVQMQVIGTSNDSCFGVDVRGNSSSGSPGYVTSVNYHCGNAFSGLFYGQAVISKSTTPNDVLKATNYDPGGAPFKYRVEVKDDTIRLLFNGAQFLSATDVTYLSGGPIRLWSNGVQLMISSFKVIAL